MTKKLSWLDKFAAEQAAKMQKVASVRTAEQAIIDGEDLPGAENGQVVEYLGVKYRVVDASFADDKGPGVLVEKVAAFGDEEVTDEVATDEATPATDALVDDATAPVVDPAAPQGGQQYSYTKLPIQETFNNDQDAQWGESSAAGTAQEIATEDATDRTTVPGKFTKSPGVNAGGMAAPVGGVDTTVPAQVPAATGVTPAEQVMSGDTTVPGQVPAAMGVTPAEQVMSGDTTVPGISTSTTPAENIYQGGAAPVATAPVATPGAAPTAPVADATVPAADDATTEAPVDEKAEDADVANKMASNRIFARMFNGLK